METWHMLLLTLALALGAVLGFKVYTRRRRLRLEGEVISARLRAANQKGFTLIELMVVVAIIGILAAIAIPIYANVTSTARIAKAKADIRTLGSAVSVYDAHMGTYPAALTDLTANVTNANGQNAGPFVAKVPNPPQGWGSAYSYSVNTATGLFELSASGDGTSFKIP